MLISIKKELLKRLLCSYLLKLYELLHDLYKINRVFINLIYTNNISIIKNESRFVVDVCKLYYACYLLLDNKYKDSILNNTQNIIDTQQTILNYIQNLPLYINKELSPVYIAQQINTINKQSIKIYNYFNKLNNNEYNIFNNDNSLTYLTRNVNIQDLIEVLNDDVHIDVYNSDIPLKSLNNTIFIFDRNTNDFYGIAELEANGILEDDTYIYKTYYNKIHSEINDNIKRPIILTLYDDTNIIWYEFLNIASLLVKYQSKYKEKFSNIKKLSNNLIYYVVSNK